MSSFIGRRNSATINSRPEWVVFISKVPVGKLYLQKTSSITGNTVFITRTRTQNFVFFSSFLEGKKCFLKFGFQHKLRSMLDNQESSLDS